LYKERLAQRRSVRDDAEHKRVDINAADLVGTGVKIGQLH
jgi:hypothetical protein